MTAKTHIAFNIAVAAALAATGVIDIHNAGTGDVALIGGLLLGGILSDIDNPNSKIRHMIRRAILPKGYRRLVSRAAMSGSSFHHRQNFTHWSLFWLVGCAVLYICCLSIPLAPVFIIGVAAGTAAHLFCDMFNPYGILLLAPFSRKKISLAKIPTNSIGEMLFFLLSILAAFLLTAYAF